MDNEKKNSRPAGIGTGYLSLMMVFVVLCLTMLAALALSAAENEKRFSEKSAAYTKEYYDADLSAKMKLAEIDRALSGYSDFGDFMLAAELDAIEGIEYMQFPDRIEASWLTPINDRQDIYFKVRFSRDGSEILSRRTVFSGETEEAPLNVWLGE